MYFKKIAKHLLISLMLLGVPTHLHSSSKKSPDISTKLLLPTTALMFLIKNFNKTPHTSSNQLLNTINKLQKNPQDLTQQEKQDLTYHITRKILELDSTSSSPSTQQLNKELNQLKKQLQQPIPTSVCPPIHRPGELLIPANGNCLYTSILLGYLLPVTKDPCCFKQRLSKIVDTKDLPITPTKLAGDYQKMVYLNGNGFRQIIQYLQKKAGIKSGIWGGPKEIQLIANILNVNIQEYTPDPDNPIQLVKSNYTQPNNWVTPTEITVHIVQDVSLKDELVCSSDDPELKEGKISSLNNSQDRHHYRLYYPNRKFFHLHKSKKKNVHSYYQPKKITPPIEDTKLLKKLDTKCEVLTYSKTKLSPQPSPSPEWSQGMSDEIAEVPLILDLPHISPAYQQRIITYLTLLQSPYLEEIINLLNKKLGPINNPKKCEEIGHYFATIGHFYLIILKKSPPATWVIESLKMDIARKEIKQKNMLILDTFDQALNTYQTKTSPKNFLNTLYTLYEYSKEDESSLHKLTTVLNHFINYPTTKVILQENLNHTLYTIQKEFIRTYLSEHKYFNELEKNSLYHILCQLITRSSHTPYPYVLLQNLLQMAMKQQKAISLFRFLHLIKHHHIDKNSLQKIFRIAQEKQLSSLEDYQKILYFLLLKEKINTTFDQSVRSHRIELPLWNLIVTSASLQQSQALFRRLFNLNITYKIIDNFSFALCELADYAPPVNSYPSIAQLILEEQPEHWLCKIHNKLLKITFSAPYEFTVEEILEEIQKSAQEESSSIGIQEIRKKYKKILKCYYKDRSSPQEVRKRTKQYKKETEGSNEKAFQIACLENDLPVAKYLIEKLGVDINIINQKDTISSLWYIAEKDWADLLGYLIYQGAAVEPSDETQYTLFQVASLSNSIKVVQWLLKHTDIDPNQCNKKWGTPLDLAALKGNLSIVKCLLKYIPNPFLAAQRAFFYAKKGQHVETIAYLESFTEKAIKNRINTFSERLKNKGKGEPFPHLPLLQYIIKVLKTPIKSDGHGNTLFHTLSTKDTNLPLIHYLLLHTDMDLYAKNNYGKSALDIAQKHGCSGIITCLKHFSRLKKKGETPAYRLQLESIKYLVEKIGLRLYKRNNQGDTPLDIVARAGLLDVVKYFIEEVGMRPMPMNNGLSHTVQVACKAGHKHICHYLIKEAGAIPPLYCCSYHSQFYTNHYRKRLSGLFYKRQYQSNYVTPIQLSLPYGYGHVWLINSLLDPSYRRGHLRRKDMSLLLLKVRNPQAIFLIPPLWDFRQDNFLQYCHRIRIRKEWQEWMNQKLPLRFFKWSQNQQIIRYLNVSLVIQYPHFPLRISDYPNKYDIGHWTKKKIIQWSKNYKNTDKKAPIEEQLAVIKRAVELHEGFSPRPVQMLSLLTLLFRDNKNMHLKGRLAQIMTGQGKSITIAMLAILHALSGKPVDIITTSPELSQREVKTKAPLFALFGLTVGDNSHEETNDILKNPYCCDILYSTPSNMHRGILLTDFYGEKELRANREFVTAIFDEVDSLFVDSSNSLTHISQQIPGMDRLQVLLATVWNLVTTIHNHIITRPGGKHYYVFIDFEQKDDEIIFHTLEQNENPEAYMVPIDIDKDAFIKNLAFKELKELFREPTQEEKEALKEMEALEKEITAANNLLKELEQQVPRPEEKIQQQSQELNVLKNKRETIAWYKNEYTTYIEFPKHLRTYVQQQLPAWIKNALYAYCYCHKDQQYTIVEGKIIPIDYTNTGVLQHNVIWSHGLNQFLSIKENCAVHPESLVTNYMSLLALSLGYKVIFGLTGTLGNQANKNFLRETYQVECITIPPHKKRKIAGNENPNLPFKVLTPHLCYTLEDYYEAKSLVISQQILAGRSLLIICRYIYQVNHIKLLAEELKSFLPIKNITTYTGEKKFRKKYIDVGEIVIATKIAGRGFDLPTTLALERNGGLHVVIMFFPKKQRIEEQNRGRTARKNNLGTVQFIIHNPKAKSIRELVRKRQLKEEKSMEKAKRDVKHMCFQDQLFREFCDVMNELMPGKEAFDKRSLRKNLEDFWKNFRQEIERSWQEEKQKNNSTYRYSCQVLQKKKLDEAFKLCCKILEKKGKEEYPDVWKDFVQRKKRTYRYPNWGSAMRDSLKEQFGLWLCSVEQLLNEGEHDAVEKKFKDFIKELRKNANQDNIPKNPYYYVQEGNRYAASGYYYKALQYYQQAIDQDPILALHACYNKAYVLFKQGKTKDAKVALQQSKKTLNQYYKPTLFTYHQLVTKKGEKDILSKQVQREFNILLLVEQYIDNALQVVQKARSNDKRVVVENHKWIGDIINEQTAPMVTTQDLNKFVIGGLTHLFTLTEVKPLSITTILLLSVISLSEIIIGSAMIVYSGGAASSIGSSLLQEGVSDLCQAFRAGYNGDFDWEEWGIQKGITVAVGIASATINSYKNARHFAKTEKNLPSYVSLREQYNDVWDISKNIRKDVGHYCKGNISKEAKSIYQLGKDTLFHHVKKGIVKECINTVIDYGIEKLLYAKMKELISRMVKEVLYPALQENQTLQQAIQVDIKKKNNDWQNRLLQEGGDILQGNWEDFFPHLIHHILQGKTSGSLNKSRWLNILSVNHICSFLRGLGIRQGGENIIPILEGLMGGIDCLACTDSFIKAFNKKIQKHTQEIQHNEKTIYSIQEAIPTFSPQKAQQYTKRIKIKKSSRQHRNMPYMPRGGLVHAKRKKQPTHHQEQDSDDDEPSIGSKEEHYIPSSIESISSVFTDSLSAKIIQTIHTKGIKPVTSRLVSYGVDTLVKTSEEKLRQAIAKQQLKNRVSYTFDRIKIKAKSSRKNTCPSSKKLQDEVVAIAKATEEGAPGDLLCVKLLAKKYKLTLYIYDEEGELLRIEGKGENKVNMTYISPTGDQPGHWAPVGIKNYKKTGPTDCLFDAIVAVIGSNESVQDMRKFCAEQIRANTKTIQPIVHSYYFLSVTNPQAIYTGLGGFDNIIILAMKAEKSWKAFKKNHPYLVNILYKAKEVTGIALCAAGAGATVATGGLAGVGGLLASMVAGVAIGKLYEYVLERNQGNIEGGKVWIAKGLQYLDSDISEERAAWAADKFMNLFIELGRLGTEYALGRTFRVIKTRVQTKLHRKKFLNKSIKNPKSKKRTQAKKSTKQGQKTNNKKYDEGVKEAQKDYPKKAGKIEYHHTHPQYLGGDTKGPTVPIDAAYHQKITNAFRKERAYGLSDNKDLKPEELKKIMDKVYSKFPLPSGYTS